MSRSSCTAERAQADPLVALAAVLALSLGLSAYLVVLDGVDSPASPTAGPTLERVRDAVTVGGVADPDRLIDAGRAARADERGVTVTLTAAGREWSAGDTPPSTDPVAVGEATARLGVALAPGRVRPGTLRVMVWR